MTFPHFLNIPPALLAGAIAIPALLILYFLKLRRREMLVSSTLLWKKAIQDLQVNSPFQKLRKNLLLLLQLLLLILLLLALARPITNMSRSAGKMAVILVDRSASMRAQDVSGGTRLDQAKKRAKELIGTLGRDAVASVIAFDDKAEVVHGYTTDTAALRQAIDSIQQTDRPTKLKLAYQLAEAQTNFNPEQLRSNVRPDVWLFSDGKAGDARELNIRGELHYEPIGTKDPSNIAIVAMSAKRNYERPTEVQVFARLANYGSQPVKADVELKIAPIDPNDPSNLSYHSSRVADVALMPESWDQGKRDQAEKDTQFIQKDSVAFKFELTTAAVIRVEQMHKDGDVLPADDVAVVVVPPPRNLKALLVTDGNYFLELAVDSLGLQHPQKMTPEAYEQAFANADTAPKFNVIIFDTYKPKHLPEAGNFIEFGAIPDGLRLKASANQELEAPVSSFLDWKRDHPLLRHLHLNLVHVQRMLKLEVPLETEVLAEGTRGPLILLDREGKQTHLVIAFDLWQSDWPRQQSFENFMVNAMQFLALGSEMQVRQSYVPGDTPRIPRANIDPKLKQFTLHGPMGDIKVPVLDAGEVALPGLEKVGIYSTEPAISDYEHIAVNLLDANESDLSPLTTAPGGVGETLAVNGGKARLELWWWIVGCGVLPLLLIEWWIYTRRVHI